MNASGMLNTCKSNVVVSIEDDRDPEVAASTLGCNRSAKWRTGA